MRLLDGSTGEQNKECTKPSTWNTHQGCILYSSATIFFPWSILSFEFNLYGGFVYVFVFVFKATITLFLSPILQASSFGIKSIEIVNSCEGHMW